MIKTKRVYLPRSRDDGKRVLVDRLWPRGMSKAKAHVDLWLKDLAPSTDLRKWYSHEPAKWLEFKRRYRAELKPKSSLLKLVRGLEKSEGTVTLLFGSREEKRNNATALKGFLS